MRALAAAAGVVRDLGELLLPRRCAGCGEPAPASRGAGLCRGCRSGVGGAGRAACAGCGAAAPAPGEAFCPGCRGGHARDAVFAAAAHAGVVRELVHALKYRADFAAGRALARLLVEELPGRAPAVELVVPVPLHPARLRKRGFNQAALLARPLARALGAPLAADLLRRLRPTRALAGLDRAAREHEVAGAFGVRRRCPVAGRRILLVDDVLTTGATAEACCRALKEAGAAWTGVAAAARAFPALARARPAAADRN